MSQEHQWIQASDEQVREHLQSKLAQLRAADSAEEALGCQRPEDLRKTFLELTKEFHPNRFARRPDDIRDLASEVFISVKEAYEVADGERASSELVAAKANAQRSVTSPLGVPRTRSDSSRPPDSQARSELKERRREQLKSRLATPIPPSKRTAQIRAATAEPPSEEGSAKDEEANRFVTAQALLQAGEYARAAEAFKSLAVGRPSDKSYRMHMHHAQGRVHQNAGNLDDARAEYKRALGLDANFTAAHEAMSSLPRENKKKKSGIISKLFGK